MTRTDECDNELKGEIAVLRISLWQLEIFVTTVECNSFTRAAENLFLVQSTVSAHISALEQALGMQLIERNARKKFSLTENGRKVYVEAKDILERCYTLQEQCEELAEGQLIIGASTVPTQCILPKLLPAFLQQRPGISYQLRKGDSTAIHAMLEGGEIRIGFVGMEMDCRHYAYVPIAEDRLVLISANNEKFRHFQQLGNAGDEILMTEPVLSRENGSGTKRAFDRYLEKNDIAAERVHIMAQIESPETIRNMVMQGMGVSIASELTVSEEIEKGNLLRFDLGMNCDQRKIYLTWRKEKLLSRIERDFIHYVQSIAAQRETK